MLTKDKAADRWIDSLVSLPTSERAAEFTGPGLRKARHPGLSDASAELLAAARKKLGAGR